MSKRFFTLLTVYTGMLVVFLGLAPVPVSSDAVLDHYRNQFRSYREARAAFDLSREKYMKLGTLAARDEAFSATQNFLSEGIGVLTSFLEVLDARISAHANVPSDLKVIAEALKAEDVAEYSALQEDVESSQTLSELVAVSNNVDTSYEENEAHAQFLNVVLVIADLRGLLSKTTLTAAEVKLTVQGDATYPGRERILGDWYVKITNKLERANGVLEESSQALQGISEEDDFEDQKVLVRNTVEDVSEAKTLNMEVVSHLLEIVRAKKY